jgi:hypothetical protein
MPAAPIFIVGCPRSGTSVLRHILDRHPSLAICDETHFHRLVYLRRSAFGELSNPANRRRVIDAYLAGRQMKRTGLDTADLAEKLLSEGVSYKALFACILSYYADSRGKPRYGEKTPQHALFLETLCEWFPNAVILHVIRDPRATVASLQAVPWSSGSVVANARTWQEMNGAARRFRHHSGYLEVRYEALVTDPVGEVRKICAFIGQEYAPSMLTAEEDSPASGLPRKRTAVTPARLEVWRKELTARQVAQIEWVLGANIEGFGYSREAPPARAITVFRGLAYAVFDRLRFVMARLPAIWYRWGAPTKIAQYEYWAASKKWRKKWLGS